MSFPKVLIAVDKFKGSLSGVELSEAIAAGMRRQLGEGFQPRICPIADGGDGTVDAALAAGFDEITTEVTGPLGEPVQARFAYETSTRTAVIEVAEACGLWRLDPDQLDTWNATTFGVGELILAALDSGARSIALGLGGSATTDAGAGMLSALGAVIEDDAGARLIHGGGALLGAASVDVSGLDSRLADIELTVACDVTNPLCGDRGAAAVYGPQKGASPEQVAQLDRALKQFSNLLELSLNVSRGTFANQQGAGAAGGLGFAALALGGHMRPGIDLCFELTGFNQALKGAEVVITGEGKLDEQTLSGKGPAGVAVAGQKEGAVVYAICGSRELTAEQAQEAGFSRTYAVLDLGVSLEESLANPRPYVEKLGQQLAQDLTAQPS